MANQIILKGGAGRYEEYAAAGAIIPGDCIEMEADGDVVVGLLATGAIIVALEDALQGSTIDTAYAALDQVFSYYPLPGDIINARAAASQTIAVGAKCGYGAAGTIVSAGVGLVAETAVTSSTLGDRIQVRVTGGTPAAS